MATLQTVTVSSPARVTDPKAVEELFRRIQFGNLNYELDADDRFHLWGYETFDHWERDVASEGRYNEPATTPFLFELADFIAPFDGLDLMTVGFEKSRVPVLASRYVVRPGRGSIHEPRPGSRLRRTAEGPCRYCPVMRTFEDRFIAPSGCEAAFRNLDRYYASDRLHRLSGE